MILDNSALMALIEGPEYDVPLKPYDAHMIVAQALDNGTLFKSDHCEECNSTIFKIEGHHDDYRYPLKVRWLCTRCHGQMHKK